MKLLPSVAAVFGLGILPLVASAADAVSAKVPTAEKANTICPVTGQPADPAIQWQYEGLTFAFADAAAREQFKAAREQSLYHQLGGKVAIDAAVEAFYVKVLADGRVKGFFENINMAKQRRKQKEFLSAAFGGPLPWTGKDMRSAHADLELKEEHFHAIAENLVATLKELKVKQELIDKVVAVALSVKDDVLNRPRGAAAR